MGKKAVDTPILTKSNISCLLLMPVNPTGANFHRTTDITSGMNTGWQITEMKFANPVATGDVLIAVSALLVFSDDPFTLLFNFCPFPDHLSLQYRR